MIDLALLVTKALIIALLAYVAITDFRYMKIWNRSLVAGIGLYAAWIILTGFATLRSDLLIALLLFSLALVFWKLRLLGGGDAKFMPICGLFCGSQGIMAFAITLIPLSLIVYLLLRFARKLPPVFPTVTGRIVAIAETSNAPYGIILAIATMIGFLVRDNAMN